MNTGLSGFFMAFGDALATRSARSQRWVARMLAWLQPVGALAFGAFVVYAFASAWPSLFTGQWPISIVSGGLFIVMILTLNLLTYLHVFARTQASQWIPESGALFPTTRRAMALALLAAARACDPLLTSPVESAPPTEQAVAPELIHGLISPLRESTLSPGAYRWLEAMGLTIIAGSIAGSIAVAGYVAVTSLLLLVTPSASVADWGLALVAGVWGPAVAFAGCALLGLGNSLRRFATLVRLGFSAEVDADGATARYPDIPGSRAEVICVAWDAVKSLSLLSYTDAKMGRHAVYLLDADHDVILWEAPPDFRYADPATRALARIRRDAAESLLRAARARTGLPLLDLTQTFTALREDRPGMTVGVAQVTSLRSALTLALKAQDEPLARDLWRLQNPPTPDKPRVEPTFAQMAQRDRLTRTSLPTQMTSAARARLLASVRALLPYIPAEPERDPAIHSGRLDMSDPARATRFVQRRTLLPNLAFVCCIAWACAFQFFPGKIADAVAWYSAPLERALPGAVAAESPIYRAPLSAAQPGWLVKAPSASDHRSAAFTPKGYTLSGTGDNQTIVAVAPKATMADGAAQVTVTLTAPASQEAYQGSGLLLESPSGTAGVVFIVDSDGNWSLRSARKTGGEWSAEDDIAWSDSSSDSQISTNSPMTLLVVRRGMTYLLYVNGHFIQAVHDDDARIAPGGPVALFLDSGDGSARFTNLRVYAMPSGMPFWAR